MPKWTEYTSKDTLADNDEVMLYDATGKANKRGLMSKFWDYVVDKMATAVISKLETDNKTIIGAINALYGKTLTASLPTIFVGTNVDFGNVIGKSGLFNTSTRACIYVCNGATNNPLGDNYIMLIHAYSYWSKHPEYFVFNSGETGTLNCEDLTSIKIDVASQK